MQTESRRHGLVAPDFDPASAFTAISRILARAAIRLASSRASIELEVPARVRLTVSQPAVADAAAKETE